MVLFPVKAIRKIVEFTGYAFSIQSYVNQSVAKCIFQFFFLYFQHGFMPEESFQYGLICPVPSKCRREEFTSRMKMTQVQRSINPESMEPLTEEKSIFYRFCEEMKIPTPRVYAYFFQNSIGWSFAKSEMRNFRDWHYFFQNDIPNEFVVKASRGVYGQCIKMYFKNSNTIKDESGQTVSPEQILIHMRANHQYESFVIQERLKTHAELACLCGSDFLHTFRVITLVDKHGDVEILHAFYKPIVGKNVIDNHDHGKLGNLICEISLSTGQLCDAVKLSPTRPGLEYVLHHPDTKFQFNGFKIPLWEEICQLAREAAYKFVPVRTIGWDIALTPEGPAVVEANMLYDPLIYGKMDILLDKLMHS